MIQATGLEGIVNRRDIVAALSALVEAIPEGSSVTVEGTPMYYGEPWDDKHELGTNILLPRIVELLAARGSTVGHYVLIDDYTGERNGDHNYFLNRIGVPPAAVFFESSFAQPTREVFEALRQRGRVFTRNRAAFLRGNHCYGPPLLWTISDRPSCTLLDACFQREKISAIPSNGNPSYHIIIHPTEFCPQQEGMYGVLKEMYGHSPPGVFINLFFKNTSISRILARHADEVRRIR